MSGWCLGKHLKICLASLPNACAGPWVHFRSVNKSLPGLEPKFAHCHMASLIPADVPVSDLPIRRILCKAVWLELELQPSLRAGLMFAVTRSHHVVTTVVHSSANKSGAHTCCR
jgi:hypothetical protein